MCIYIYIYIYIYTIHIYIYTYIHTETQTVGNICRKPMLVATLFTVHVCRVLGQHGSFIECTLACKVLRCKTQ